MGADYLSTCVIIDKDYDSFIADLKSFIIESEDSIIDKIFSELYEYDEDVINESRERNILLNLIEAFDDLVRYGKDLSILIRKGIQVVVTGGFSWGDYPTDSFEIIMDISIIQDHMERKNG